MTLVKGHLNQLLTNYSVATAKQAGLIADIVAPPVSVAEYSGAYIVFGEEDLRLEDLNYAEHARIARTKWTESDTAYVCKEYAEEASLSWLRMKTADGGLALERRATLGLARKMALNKEKLVADLYASASFTHTAALAAADRWDVDTSEPVKKVSDAMEAVRALIGVDPNIVFIGAHIWAHLRNHPDITQRVAGLVAGTPATLDQAANALGIDRLVVGKAIYNTAKEGQTVSHSDIWGKNAYIGYIDPVGGGDAEGTIVPAQQFVCDAAGTPMGTFTYEDESARSHIVQCYDCRAVVQIADNALYRFTTVVS